MLLHTLQSSFADAADFFSANLSTALSNEILILLLQRMVQFSSSSDTYSFCPLFLLFFVTAFELLQAIFLYNLFEFLTVISFPCNLTIKDELELS